MNEPVRILQIVAGMDRGGIENFIMNVYRKIDRSRLQFDFLYHTAAPCAFDEEILSLGGRIYRFPMSQGVNIPAYCRFLDTFFTEHTEYRVCHGHYSMFGVFYNYYAKKHGIPMRIGHSHTTQSLGSGLNNIADRLLTPLFRLGLTDRIACSEQAGRYMFGKKSFSLCKNGIDSARFPYSEDARMNIRQQYGIPGDCFVLGTVGQLRAEKNQQWLAKPLAALLARYPHVRLLLVGDGDRRTAIEKAFAAEGVSDAVIFAGIQADTAPFYSAMDAFLLPSLFEGLGIVAIEAQAAGLHCLLSNEVPRDAALCDTVTFLPLSEPEQWVNAVAALIEEPRRHTNGIETVRAAGYDITATAAELQERYLRAYLN